MQSKWYKQDENDSIWWLDNAAEKKGEFIFSFDKEKKYNLFLDYPDKLTAEQKRIFDEENPFWADYFTGRV